MLEVRDLTVRYGPTVAVEGLDLDVGAGERVALLGANGAGKTSTLQAISRVVPATGTVRFADADLSGLPAEAVARRGLVQVPEGRHIFGPLTAHENLQLGTTSRGARESAYEIDDVYELFPALRLRRSTPGWALSGGEQQMLAIGRALVAGPRLLLLDEPSLGLAPVVADAVFDALTQVVHHMAVLVVEQNTDLALALCERAYVLARGHVVLEGRTSELGDRDELLTAYLGSAAGSETPTSPDDPDAAQEA